MPACVRRAVLLPELPYREASRLAQIHELNLKTGETSPWVTYRDTADFRAQSRSFEGIAPAEAWKMLRLFEHEVLPVLAR